MASDAKDRAKVDSLTESHSFGPKVGQGFVIEKGTNRKVPVTVRAGKYGDMLEVGVFDPKDRMVGKELLKYYSQTELQDLQTTGKFHQNHERLTYGSDPSGKYKPKVYVESMKSYGDEYKGVGKLMHQIAAEYSLKKGAGGRVQLTVAHLPSGMQNYEGMATSGGFHESFGYSAQDVYNKDGSLHHKGQDIHKKLAEEAWDEAQLNKKIGGEYWPPQGGIQKSPAQFKASKDKPEMYLPDDVIERERQRMEQEPILDVDDETMEQMIQENETQAKSESRKANEKYEEDLRRQQQALLNEQSAETVAGSEDVDDEEDQSEEDSADDAEVDTEPQDQQQDNKKDDRQDDERKDQKDNESKDPQKEQKQDERSAAQKNDNPDQLKDPAQKSKAFEKLGKDPKKLKGYGGAGGPDAMNSKMSQLGGARGNSMPKGGIGAPGGGAGAGAGAGAGGKMGGVAGGMGAKAGGAGAGAGAGGKMGAGAGGKMGGAKGAKGGIDPKEIQDIASKALSGDKKGAAKQAAKAGLAAILDKAYMACLDGLVPTFGLTFILMEIIVLVAFILRVKLVWWQRWLVHTVNIIIVVIVLMIFVLAFVLFVAACHASGADGSGWIATIAGGPITWAVDWFRGDTLGSSFVEACKNVGSAIPSTGLTQ
ncbi:hypothetical protein IPM19_03505 [bacterium]|nr:MAG: hypothetical protein IPM19_03505 [bacterium]